MSIGEDRVRTKFNPSADSVVDQIKQKSAGDAAMWAVKAATA